MRLTWGVSWTRLCQGQGENVRLGHACDDAQASLGAAVLLQEGRDGVPIHFQPGGVVGRELGVQRLALGGPCGEVGTWTQLQEAGLVFIPPAGF